MSKHIHNQNYLENVRRGLRQNSTSEEEILWQELRNRKLGVKFRRQHSVGNFVVDFFCAEKRLAIELDGYQHRQSHIADDERSNYLNSLNIKIIRFWNSEITNNIHAVISKILNELNQDLDF